MKTKRMLTVLLALCMIFSLSVPMAYAATGMEIAISADGMEAVKVGSQLDDISFKVYYSNWDNAAADLTATLTLRNETLGETIDTVTDTVNVPAKSRMAEEYTFDFNDRSFGVLKLTVSLSSGESATYNFARVNSAEQLNYSFGLNSNHGFEWKDAAWTNETAESIIAACKAAGIGYIRDGIEWQVAYGKAGNKNQLPDDAVAFYKKITDAGIKVLYNVLYGNTVYQGTAHTDMPTNDTSRAAFAEFCGNVAAQLDGMVSDYAIWNEPDLSYANTNNATGTDYAALVEKAEDAIEYVNENNTVVGMVTNGHLEDSFEVEAKNAGALNHLDAVSYNIYYNGSEETPEDGFNSSIDTGKNFAEDKALWITEVGANTYDDSETNSAAKLAKILAINVNSGKVERMFYYSMMDRATGTEGAEMHFGQIKADGTPKPGLAAIAFANSIIGTATSNGMTSSNVGGFAGIGSTKAYDYRYTTTDGNKVAVVWAAGSVNNTVSFTAEAGKKIYAYDMYGNLKSETAAESVSASLTKEPQYFVYAAEAPVNGSENGGAGGGTGSEPGVTESCSITAEKGKVVVSGVSNSKWVSVYAFKDGKSIEESVYMDQIAVGADNEFNAEFALPTDDFYLVKVSQDATSENVIVTPEMAVLFNFYAGGNRVGSLSALKEAANASSKITIDVLEGGVMGIAAVYNGDQLLSVDTQDTQTMTFDNMDITSANKIRLMLWSDLSNLKPYIEAIELN